MKPEDISHLNSVIDTKNNPFMIVTKQLEHLGNILSGERERILIRGGKGTGKSFSLGYVMCHCVKLNKFCVILTPWSNNELLLKFLQKYNSAHVQEPTLSQTTQPTDDSPSIVPYGKINDEILCQLQKISISLKDKFTVAIDLGVLPDNNDSQALKHVSFVSKVLKWCWQSTLVVADNKQWKRACKQHKRN